MDCRGRKGRLTAVLCLAALVGTLYLLEVRYRDLTASYRALAAGHAIQDSPSEVEEELQAFLSPSKVLFTRIHNPTMYVVPKMLN